MSKTAVVIGAGAAGLTAAFELLKRTNMRVIVLEASQHLGGLCRTVDHCGNRMDIGGHRFFSKSSWVNERWKALCPDMLECQRLSRILFERKFFDYPLSMSLSSVRKLGFGRTARFGLSYLESCLHKREEDTLEDFLINRFGRALYETFFRDYTEKVWGVPCNRIDASWGAQRIKGLSIGKALLHCLKRTREASLIDRYLYPPFGPGQIWEKCAEEVREHGGEIHLNAPVVELHHGDMNSIATVVTRDGERIACDHVFSSMPVQELMLRIRPSPDSMLDIANGLCYRDFVTVGLLVKRTKVHLPDNWIYVQEPDVMLGRIQVFNNWSPHLVHNPADVWLGLEYFCNEGEPFWRLDDSSTIAMAALELTNIGLIEFRDVIDGTVARAEKAYPAYFGSYRDFPTLRSYLDSIPNLYCIGRNGQHRYNNMDHSMLTAKAAVDALVEGTDKRKAWEINTEHSYHEE